MTTATITTRENLIFVDFQSARTVSVPRRRRAVWHWPWWWPTALRTRIGCMERDLNVLLTAVRGYEGCPS